MALNLRNKFWFVVLSCTCRFIFATTFIVSGFLKSIDPWGTILAIESYLAAYNMTAPEWLIEIGAIGLGAAELILGLMLLFSTYIRITTVVSVVVMFFFTVLTLLSATVVPVEDCGCFGELIKLTPWQTFAKNAVLLPMAICFWYHYRKEQPFEFWKRDIALTLVFFAGAIGLGVYSYLHLPLIDTTPYKKGVNIAEEITAVEAEPTEEKVVLVYRNRQTDELREFSVEDTAWQNDSLWVWVETKVEEADNATPVLLEFYVRDNEGDKTKELLAKPKLYMLFVQSGEYGDDVRSAFAKVEQYAAVNGGEVVYITPQELFSVQSELPCYNMDPKTMKTILRAEYGLVELEQGVIAAKYNYRDIPY
jgi:hypothetical protein